jgi:hypothetical protein
MGMLKRVMCALPSGDPTNRSGEALGLPGMRGGGSRRPQGEGSRIGAPGGYGVRAPGWLRDVRVFLPIRFLYWFPQPGFEELGEPGFGFKGFQGVV